MAAPIVSATSSANNFGASGDLTLTPPSSIQDGDILLLVAGAYARGGSITCSGFTQISDEVIVAGSLSRTTALYKVASSESGNYTVSVDNAEGGAAVMFRLTGDAISLFNFDTEEDSSSTDTVRKQSPSLLVMFGHSRDDIGHSGYTITHGSANPTWTELYDVSATAADQAFFCAYATTTDTSDITAWSYTESGAATNTAQLIVALSTQSVTGTHSQLSTTPTFFSSPTTVGVTGTHAQLAVSPTMNAPTASGTTPTQWVNESSPTTTWVNEQK